MTETNLMNIFLNLHEVFVIMLMHTPAYLYCEVLFQFILLSHSNLHHTLVLKYITLGSFSIFSYWKHTCLYRASTQYMQDCHGNGHSRSTVSTAQKTRTEGRTQHRRCHTETYSRHFARFSGFFHALKTHYVAHIEPQIAVLGNFHVALQFYN